MSKIAKRLQAEKRWQPLQRAKLSPTTPEYVIETMKLSGQSYEKVLADIAHEEANCEYWLNDIYQVEIERKPELQVARINIRRRDGKPIFRDWRHFQAIKNQLIGDECEAVELYPAESRKVDSSNKYHLWGSTDPTFRFPLGYNYRDVTDETSDEFPGMKQRPGA